jgi:lipopolysaccharide transport system ATP-binding protein
MPEPIIRAENVSKTFRISHDAPERYLSLRDVIVRKARALFGSGNKAPATTTEDFYALRDVSFDVEPGDRIGIIGRNGAGKSTLLKILSRITEPTSGRVRLSGRVASLLEVGTGFHPELSGRENIFLNGAILGMTRAEIRRKFDEIVAFSEVERFLDTPVKRYSSGMYVRLAFAVAAHLEPEILVIDEVLAVGDAQFQKKCLGKMEDVSKQEGRTVLFVSHNTGVVAQLCNKAMLLDAGQVVMTGRTDTVIDAYVNLFNETTSGIVQEQRTGENLFSQASMVDSEGNSRTEYRFDEEVIISLELFLDSFSADLELALRLMDRHKNPVFTIHERIEPHFDRTNNLARIGIAISSAFIAPGTYSWLMCINQPGVTNYDLKNDVLSFRVLESGSLFARYEGGDYGSVFARYSIRKQAS